MTNNGNPFSRFIDLVKLDRGIYELNEKIQAIADEITILREQEKKFADELDKAKDGAHNAKKRVAGIELEIKDLDAQELKKKSQFERVSGQKEYYAVQAELEQLNKRRLELEDDLINAWHDVESVERDYQKKKLAADEHLQKLVQAMDAKQQEMQAMQAETATHAAQRSEKEQAVPQEWLDTYITMRSRVPDPVVPEENGVCSVCMYPVTGQDMISLGRKKLLQCKGCFRLLYLASVAKS